jgi:type IV secretory pathway VirB6-like protein
MNGLAQPAMAVMATGAGAPPITGVAFDSLVARTLATGLDLFKTVGVAPSTWIMLGVVPLYFGISLLAICAAYLVWLLPHVILQLLVAIGPIACATLAFPVTRSIFHGWARTCLSMVMLQLLLFCLLTVILGADDAVTQQVMGMATNGIDSAINPQGGLLGAAFGAAAVNLLLGFAAISLPAVAAAITGGAYVSGMGVAGAAGSGASGAAERAAARAVAGGSAPQAAASPPRAPILPPGPAIWSSRP